MWIMDIVQLYVNPEYLKNYMHYVLFMILITQPSNNYNYSQRITNIRIVQNK